MRLLYYKHEKRNIADPLAREMYPLYDLTIVQKGQLEYEVDGEEIVAKQGDAVFIAKNTVRSRKHSSNVEFVSFNFSQIDDVHLPTLIHNALNDVTQPLITAFDIVKQQTSNLTDSRLTLILRAIVEQLVVQQNVRDDNKLVAKIKHYVQSNLQNKITLKDIAQHVSFSVPYVERVFKQCTNVSVIEYVIEQRIMLAKNLLFDSELVLKQVAQKCGFDDYNFFARMFKKHVGCSPSKYQQTV